MELWFDYYNINGGYMVMPFTCFRFISKIWVKSFTKNQQEIIQIFNVRDNHIQVVFKEHFTEWCFWTKHTVWIMAISSKEKNIISRYIKKVI